MVVSKAKTLEGKLLKFELLDGIFRLLLEDKSIAEVIFPEMTPSKKHSYYQLYVQIKKEKDAMPTVRVEVKGKYIVKGTQGTHKYLRGVGDPNFIDVDKTEILKYLTA